ncbi:hypothetical protein SB6424_04705 [Klebsiella pasteurii]|nr:hypothetical protein SB6424_04705 [Klebsiella pasteurii]
MRRKFLKHEDINYTKNPNVRSWYPDCSGRNIFSIFYVRACYYELITKEKEQQNKLVDNKGV